MLTFIKVGLLLILLGAAATVQAVVVVIVIYSLIHIIMDSDKNECDKTKEEKQ